MPTDVTATISNDELVALIQIITNKIHSGTDIVKFHPVYGDGSVFDVSKASPVAIASNILTINAVEVPVKRAVINAALSGANVVVAGVPSKKIMVISWLLTVDGTVTLTLRSSTTSNISGAMALSRTEVPGFPLGWNPTGWFETVAGEDLNFNLSAAIGVRGFLSYVEV